MTSSTAGRGLPPLGSVIREGKPDLSLMVPGRRYEHITPSGHRYALSRSWADGGLLIGIPGSGKRARKLFASPAPESAMRIFPVLLSLLDDIIFANQVMLSRDEDRERRLDVVLAYASAFREPSLLSDSGEEPAVLSPEDTLVAGLLPDGENLLPGEVPALSRLFYDALRKECLETGFTVPDAWPAQFTGVTEAYGIASILTDPERAMLMSDLMAFLVYDAEYREDTHRSFGEFRLRTGPGERARLARMYSSGGSSGVVPQLSGAPRRGWWLVISPDAWRAVEDMTAVQVASLMRRGPWCPSAAGPGLLVRAIAAGEIASSFSPVITGAMSRCCADPGLSDWVLDRLTASAGIERALALISRAKELDLELDAATWLGAASLAEDMPDAPAEWLLTLAT